MDVFVKRMVFDLISSDWLQEVPSSPNHFHALALEYRAASHFMWQLGYINVPCNKCTENQYLFLSMQWTAVMQLWSTATPLGHSFHNKRSMCLLLGSSGEQWWNLATTLKKLLSDDEIDTYSVL